MKKDNNTEIKGLSFIDVKKATLTIDTLFDGLKDVVDINELREEISEVLKYGGKVYALKKHRKEGKPIIVMCGIIVDKTLFGNDEELEKRKKLSFLLEGVKDDFEMTKIYANKEYATPRIKNHFLCHVNECMQDSISMGCAVSYTIGELKYEKKTYKVFGSAMTIEAIALLAGIIVGIVTHNFTYGLLIWLLFTLFASSKLTFKGKDVNKNNYRNLTFSTEDAFFDVKKGDELDEIKVSVNNLFITSM
ncbi:hypothetical protein [Eubacterium sp.]|uniref:hypothetical protein n=1 Tax=Eubacterium sp. TaxID=142586 RepID=UPI0025DEFA1E|nr:hypothetical protein [Eubacterium sp.]MCR5629096.1 hypothetical protein [Eubacterium sp.]